MQATIDVRPLDAVPRGRALAPVLLAGATLFTTLQCALVLHNLHAWDQIRARAAARSPIAIPTAHVRSDLESILLVAIGSLIVYASFVVVELAIVGRGRRYLWAAPAVAYSFIGLSSAPGAMQAIGVPWFVRVPGSGATPWYSGSYAGPVLDLVLVLAPVAFMIATSVTYRPRHVIAVDGTEFAAVSLLVAVAVIVVRTGAVVGHASDAGAFGAALLAGLLVGARRPWWPWLHLVFAMVAAGAIAWALAGGAADGLVTTTIGFGRPATIFAAAIPLIAVVVIAALWEPLSAALRRSEQHPFALFVATNVLNVADAVFTVAGIRSRNAVELNPAVRYAGFPLKIAIVAIASWLLYLRRPRALIWPGVALLCVLGYHLSGLVVNAR